jgi:metal transporter CNNM
LVWLYTYLRIRCFLLSNQPVEAPIAWPISKLLDCVLGTKEQHTYKKAELKSFLQFHRTGDEPLRDEEITILNGVLELNTKNVETIMTPLKVRVISPEVSIPMTLCFLLQDTVCLSADDILDYPAVHAMSFPWFRVYRSF